MLRAVNQPAVVYDLIGIENRGLITVGRETEAALRLDSPDIPFLLSRKHATLQLQPDGKFMLSDLGSTNGTYAARAGQPLRKLVSRWELQDSDVIAFGGPETVIVQRSHVRNPFIFKFYASFNHDIPESDGALMSGDLQVQSDQHNAFNGSIERSADHAAGPPTFERCATVKSAADIPHDLEAADASVIGQRPATTSGILAQCSPTGVMKDILVTHLSCPICQDWLVACHALTCGHMYCGLCLATWLNENQTCPSCRKPAAGVPVRCFQVDSTINDLLDQGVNLMSPGTKRERDQKQRHWDHVQGTVVPDWALTLHRRKQRASEAAAQHHRGSWRMGALLGNEKLV